MFHFFENLSVICVCGGHLMCRSPSFQLLIVLGAEFEVGLRMVAYGAYLWCFGAYYDVSAVAALPDAVAVA